MVLAGLLVAGGVAYHSLTTPVFRATAIFKVEQRTFLPPLPDNFHSSGPFWMQAQGEILRSSEILDRVIKNLQLDQAWDAKNARQAPLRNDEVRWMLWRRLDYQELGKSNLFAIQMDNEDPNEAAAIANEIVKVYHDFRVKPDRIFMESANYKERIEAYRKDYASYGKTLTDTGKPTLVEIVERAKPPLRPIRPAIAVTAGLLLSGAVMGLFGLIILRR